MKIVIFGGTGSLGKALVKKINTRRNEVHVISRCEIRQAEMQDEFPCVKFHLGDVTNPHSLPYIPKPSAVFNLAAMKHVERGQDNHEYAVNVNYNGVINTYSWAFEHGAKCYVQSSTDKAVEPINTYGKAKSLAEDYLLSRNRAFPITIYSWGNVICSRGSVIPKFVESLDRDGSLYITDFNMTRFWLTLDEVSNFMLKNYKKGGYRIPKMKGAKVLDVGIACAKIMGLEFCDLNIIQTGNRGGEKIHEKLGGIESNKCEQFTMDELCTLLEPFVIGLLNNG